MATILKIYISKIEDDPDRAWYVSVINLEGFLAEHREQGQRVLLHCLEALQQKVVDLQRKELQ